jgi:hypothetical protein
METKIKRKEFYDDRTISHFFWDTTLFCYILEDKDRDLENGGVKVPGETAIPRGRYRIVITWSNRFKRRMPELLNVPQFTGIRFHDGRGPENTEGCPCMSYSMRIENGKHWLVWDKKAFDDFFLKLDTAIKSGEEVWCTVE